VEWVRIHKLPDYVYFDHSVHVTAGVGCVECHGRIDQMEQVRMEKPLSMGWCLDCHRDVKSKQGDSDHIRPVAQMTNMAYVHEGHVDPPRHLDPPENCWGCHR
ncbi:MAG TPA: cytochrome c3 family protein, partial [Polyangiaceae bacterium]|nr:cytochrome c3 family protein [Polyangiaceae bacterium]